MKCYYRTVRNNRIRLLGQRLCCKNLKNGELDGRRLCFIPYAGKCLQLLGKVQKEGGEK